MSFLENSAHIRDMNRKITAVAAMLLTVAVMCVLMGNFLNSSHAYADTKTIYLTFDDGPSDRITPKILDVLKEEKVPATFFIVGGRAEDRMDILIREYSEGHTLAVHSYTHKYREIYRSKEALINDIEACNKLICGVTGKKSRLYRFPGGSFTVKSELKKAVKDAGYKYVDWNASFCDSEIKNGTVSELFRAAVNSVAKPERIVMLAHDTTDKTNTPAALKKVIQYYKQKGYVFKKF